MGKGKWLKRVSMLVLIFFSSSTIVQAGGIPGGFAPQNNKDLRELDKKGEAAVEGKACTTEYNAMDQEKAQLRDAKGDSAKNCTPVAQFKDTCNALMGSGYSADSVAGVGKNSGLSAQETAMAMVGNGMNSADVKAAMTKAGYSADQVDSAIPRSMMKEEAAKVSDSTEKLTGQENAKTRGHGHKYGLYRHEQNGEVRSQGREMVREAKVEAKQIISEAKQSCKEMIGAAKEQAKLIREQAKNGTPEEKKAARQQARELVQTVKGQAKQLMQEARESAKQIKQEAKHACREMQQKKEQPAVVVDDSKDVETQKPVDSVTNEATTDKPVDTATEKPADTTDTGKPAGDQTKPTTTAQLPAYNSAWDTKYATQFGDMDPATLTTAAWTNLAANDIEATIACALKCINLYAQQATETKDAGLINHVGTAYFILGQALEKAGDKQGAALAYQTQLTQFAGAQAYDPASASWWSVSAASQEKLDALGVDLTQTEQKTDTAATDTTKTIATDVTQKPATALTDTTTKPETTATQPQDIVKQQEEAINNEVKAGQTQVDTDMADQKQAMADAVKEDTSTEKPATATLVDALSAAKAKQEQAFTAANEKRTAAFAKAKENGLQAIAEAKEKGASIIDAVKGWMSSLLDAIQTWVSEISTAVQTWVADITAALKGGTGDNDPKAPEPNPPVVGPKAPEPNPPIAGPGLGGWNWQPIGGFTVEQQQAEATVAIGHLAEKLGINPADIKIKDVFNASHSGGSGTLATGTYYPAIGITLEAPDGTQHMYSVWNGTIRNFSEYDSNALISVSPVSEKPALIITPSGSKPPASPVSGPIELLPPVLMGQPIPGAEMPTVPVGSAIPGAEMPTVPVGSAIPGAELPTVPVGSAIPGAELPTVPVGSAIPGAEMPTVPVGSAIPGAELPTVPVGSAIPGAEMPTVPVGSAIPGAGELPTVPVGSAIPGAELPTVPTGQPIPATAQPEQAMPARTATADISDVDGNGVLSVGDTITIGTMPDKLLWQMTVTQESFAAFDADQNGSVSTEELQSALSAEYQFDQVQVNIAGRTAQPEQVMPALTVNAAIQDNDTNGVLSLGDVIGIRLGDTKLWISPITVTPEWLNSSDADQNGSVSTVELETTLMTQFQRWNPGQVHVEMLARVDGTGGYSTDISAQDMGYAQQFFNVTPTYVTYGKQQGESGEMDVTLFFNVDKNLIGSKRMFTQDGTERMGFYNAQGEQVEVLIKKEGLPFIGASPEQTPTPSSWAAVEILNKNPDAVGNMFSIAPPQNGAVALKSIIEDTATEVKLLLVDQRTGQEQAVLVNLETGTIEQLVQVDQVLLDGNFTPQQLLAGMYEHGWLRQVSEDQVISSVGYSNMPAFQSVVAQAKKSLIESGIFPEAESISVLLLDGIDRPSGEGYALRKLGVAAIVMDYEDFKTLSPEKASHLVALMIAHEGTHVLNYQRSPGMTRIEDEASGYEASYKTTALLFGADAPETQADLKVSQGWEILANNLPTVATVFSIPESQVGSINYTKVFFVDDTTVGFDLYNMQGGQQKTIGVNLATGVIQELMSMDARTEKAFAILDNNPEVVANLFGITVDQLGAIQRKNTFIVDADTLGVVLHNVNTGVEKVVGVNIITSAMQELIQKI